MAIKVLLMSVFVAFLSEISIAEDQFVYPLDVAIGPDQTVYVADRKLPGIWKVVDGKPEIFFKGSKTFRTPLNAVRCVVVDSDGTVFAGDSATREVYAFGEDRKPVPLTNGSIGIAADLLIDGEKLVVSDLETQRIWTFPKSGGKPEEVAVIAGVRGIAKDADGHLVCVTTLENPVRRIKENGEFELIIHERPFQMPHHCVIVEDKIFVADNYASTIWQSDLKAKATPEALVSSEPLQKPVGICRYKDGFLVADPHAKQIFVIDAERKIVPLVKSATKE